MGHPVSRGKAWEEWNKILLRQSEEEKRRTSDSKCAAVGWFMRNLSLCQYPSATLRLKYYLASKAITHYLSDF